MSQYLRLLNEADKAQALASLCAHLRQGGDDPRHFLVHSESFNAVPGKPFAYWVGESVRGVFSRLPALECDERTARQGLATADDFRFVRIAWETKVDGQNWINFAKGGSYSPFYADTYLAVSWANEGAVLNAFGGSVVRNPDFYLRPGLTWPRRTTSDLGLRAMPQGCIFADKGPAAFVAEDDPDSLLALLALTNSHAFGLLVSLQLAAADAAARSYEVGIIQKTPVPDLNAEQPATLAALVINDVIEPKLKEVGAGVTALRNKGAARSREEEKQFESLQTFELELMELRDTLLKLAPTYKPNRDDGVQITAAPLWPLFRYKPWQKVIKDTWAKLEKGDFNWAHLAMNYWPECVREKCKSDKSLAIAHGLEELFIELDVESTKSSGGVRK
ncbi:hypothetical protein [Cupriavidus necator]|uniref:hypothetical protein n=1 Tax=Cupriavidus necator TaxID=106590 RepID=UPI0009B64386|nr:hypothetical protein [Cupriavidus necator]MDX6012847.1 hypothetical protein [Cupriavidus necator]